MFAHPMRGWSERDFMRFFVQYDFDRQGMAIHVARRKPYEMVDQTQVAKVEWVDKEDDGQCSPPMMVCHQDTLQHLFNALWEQGYRPPIQVKQDAVTEAKDSHLDDLRKMLFKQLGVK